MKIDLGNFQKNSSFYGELNLLLTVKSFNLQDIRKRYLISKKNNRTGSVERRKASLGGIVSVSLKNGKSCDNIILSKLKEPRGIDFSSGLLAISSENQVYILTDKLTIIKNDWFSYIHTVKFSPFDNKKILISSSGYDCMFEYDWKKNNNEWEWFAWENGIFQGKDTEANQLLYLTRQKKQFKYWKQKGLNSLLIDDPKTQQLPTAKRAAFINSVSYHANDKNILIATLFHKGCVAQINRNTGIISILIDGLKNPHGGFQSNDLLFVTNTSSGEVIINDNTFCFKNLLEKSKALGSSEWLQNSIIIDDFVLTIDSNRTSFVIYHPEKKLYDIIPYNYNWAIQDVINAKINDKQIELLENISLSNG